MGKIVSRKELVKLRRRAQKEGRKVVFTNGCFDLLHRGHIQVLSKAKELGEILIVGLNSDASVKKIKGKKRPLVREEDRATILSALEVVDYVCLFDEPTPEKLISQVLPDFLVKGGDYRIEEIVGRRIVEERGGKVFLVEKLPGYSTQGLIDLIVKRYGHKGERER